MNYDTVVAEAKAIIEKKPVGFVMYSVTKNSAGVMEVFKTQAGNGDGTVAVCQKTAYADLQSQLTLKEWFEHEPSMRRLLYGFCLTYTVFDLVTTFLLG